VGPFKFVLGRLNCTQEEEKKKLKWLGKVKFVDLSKYEAVMITKSFQRLYSIFSDFFVSFFISIFIRKCFFLFYPSKLHLDHCANFGLFLTAFWSTILALYHQSKTENQQGVPLWLIRGVRVKKSLRGTPNKT
jgi:hypothetical protein